GGPNLELAWTGARSASDVTEGVGLYATKWNGSAFIEELPGDAMAGGISPVVGAIQTLALTMDPQGHTFVAWDGGASGTSQVYVRGNLFDPSGTVYHVNASNSLQQVLANNTLRAGDVVLVDPGATVPATPIAGDLTGVVLLGAPGLSSTIQGTLTLNGATGL